MGEIIDLFTLRARKQSELDAALARQPRRGREHTMSFEDRLTACETLIVEAKAVLELLTYDKADDKTYLATRDEMGWGTRHLSRRTRTCHDYNYGDKGYISMLWGAYLCQQRLRRVENVIRLARKGDAAGLKTALSMDALRLPQEDAILGNVYSNPRHLPEICRGLAITDRAIKTLIAPLPPVLYPAPM